MRILTIFIILFFSLLYSAKSDLGLIENVGQLPSDIKYYAKLDGINLFLKSDGLYLDFYRSYKVPEMDKVFKAGQVVKMDLNHDLNSLFTKGKVISKNNYLFGNKDNWLQNVPVYDNIILDNVYDNIDLRVYLDEGTPRYDFLVRPGANLDDIAYSFTGTKSFKVENQKVEFEAEMFDIVTSKLLAYQEIDGKRKIIDCKFINNNGMLSFQSENYDTEHTLVIDPVVFSSYFGGLSEDKIVETKLVDENEFVIAGYTNSVEFPTTEGVYQDFYNFDSDGFVSRIKLNGNDREIIYSTYIGGTQEDKINAFELTATNEVVIVGQTRSQDYPTINPYQNSISGDLDLFITKLSVDGSFIIGSTYHGGSSFDIPHDVAIDPAGDIYIVGETNSVNFPVVSAYASSKLGTVRDAFVLKVNDEIKFIEYSTYFGGADEDVAYAIAVDNQGNAYFCGGTKSTDMDTAPVGFGGTPHDENHNLNWDMFFSKLTNGGGTLELSTYYGGAGDDIAYGITLDEDLGYFFVGSSTSDAVEFGNDGLAISSIGYQPKRRGSSDLVVGKLSPLISNGQFSKKQDLLLATFLGGSKIDKPNGIALNKDLNSLVVFGYTESNNFPEESQDGSDYESGTDGFVSYISTDCSTLNYSEFFGGSGDDEITGIQIGLDQSLYYSGSTNSTDLFVSSNAFKSDNESQSGFIGKKVFGTLELTSPDQTRTYCKELTIPINWFLEGDFTNSNYKINLLSTETDYVFNVDDNYTGSSPYSWEVDDNIPVGNYKMEIIHPNGLSGISSNEFKITARPEIETFDFSNGEENICIGEDVSFLVTTTFDDDFTYEWYKDGSQIPDAAGFDYGIQAVEKADSGEYSVVVDGECNPNEESSKLIVNVQDITEINSQSESSLTFFNNSNASISVEAIGAELSYQWFFNGNEILGKTNKDLVFENINTSNAGVYFCEIEGKCGEMVTSSDIKIEIDTETSVTIANKGNSNFNLEYIRTKLSNVEFVINSKNNTSAELMLIDGLGRNRFKSYLNISQGISKNNVSISNLESGVYILAIKSKEGLITSKFIVTK
ncbi:SBBP repeat-containing protein [Candidatus Kapabacteria bacterium]|nr:SBBP repeat-containing protein [Candidatus Kapabacteria bacterium]